MAISILCPGCDADYSVPDNLVGKTIRCKSCGETIAVKAAKAKARVTLDDDDDDRPVRKSARRRDDEDDDEVPAKKGGLSPVLIGGLAALLLAGAAGASYFLFTSDSPEGQAQGDPAPIKRPIPKTGNDRNRNPGEEKTEEPKTEEPKVEEKQPEEKKTEPVKADDTTKPAEKSSDTKKTGDTKKSTDTKKTEEPKAAPTTALGPASPRESQSPGGLLSYSDYIQCNMPSLIQEQVKKSTVLFRVDGGEGSGWFAMEPGIVITNAHVLHMLGRNPKPPKKIQIFINAGENDEREIASANIKILAVDGKIDLAMLRISNEKDLPPPLKVRPAGELELSQRLRVFGFPLGSNLREESGVPSKNPEMSVRPTTVTAKRHDDFGVLQTIQHEGGVTNGNSGGPIVDGEGFTRMVVVRGYVNEMRQEIEQTQSSAIPTEWVIGLAAGRLQEVEYGEPIKVGGKVKIPVKVTMLDPLKRVTKVGVRHWIGSNVDKPRAPGSTPAKKEESDTEHKEVLLKYDPEKKVAIGHIDTDLLTNDKTMFWGQVFYGNALNPIYYEPANSLPVHRIPVEEVDALLVAKAEEGTIRTLTLANSGKVQVLRDGQGEEDAPQRRLDQITMREIVGKADPADPVSLARLRLQYEKFSLKILIGRSERDITAAFTDDINKIIKRIEAYAWVNKQGEVYKTKTNALNLTGLTPQGVNTLVGISNGVLESLVYASVPMPNESVKAGHQWTSSKDVGIVYGYERIGAAPANNAPPRPEDMRKLEARFTMKVTYKYVGIRLREGRKEAIIEVDGIVEPLKGKRPDTAKGSIKGRAAVELDTGTVIDSVQDVEFEVDISGGGVKRSLVGKDLYKLNRSAKTN